MNLQQAKQAVEKAIKSIVPDAKVKMQAIKQSPYRMKVTEGFKVNAANWFKHKKEVQEAVQKAVPGWKVMYGGSGYPHLFVFKEAKSADAIVDAKGIDPVPGPKSAKFDVKSDDALDIIDFYIFDNNPYGLTDTDLLERAEHWALEVLDGLEGEITREELEGIADKALRRAEDNFLSE